jgi:DNA polymerase-3 subunit delta
VLVVTAGALDRRHAWVRAFADAGALVECEAPRDARALAAFARGLAQRTGVRLADGAAERLAERVGPHLLRLASELEKASLLAGPGREVTLEHVSRAVADLAEEPVWELTDAIGDGRAGDALALLAKLLAGGAPPPLVLGTLAAHFRKLLRLRSGGALAAPPFVRRKLEAQARRYAPGRLAACLRAVHETDEALKGQGGLAPELALERLVIGLSS